jgi:hypothetical protein
MRFDGLRHHHGFSGPVQKSYFAGRLGMRKFFLKKPIEFAQAVFAFPEHGDRKNF